MSNEAIRSKAIELSKKAVDLDSQKDYEQAYTIYKQAINYFFHLIKCKVYLDETNPYIKEQFQTKLVAFLERAETLHKSFHTQEPVLASGKEESNSSLKKALQSAVLSEKPNVKWNDVAGLEQAKCSLQEAIIIPSRFPELFVGKRTPWKGILLYGPPGTGKSFLAKACATEAEATFFSVSSSDLVSKYMGESERLVKCLFEMAREAQPSIIFVDEIDSLCGRRSEEEHEASRRIKTEFFVQMQGVGPEDKHLLVLAATNIPWHLDTAMRRRFEKRIYIPLPDQTARRRMFELGVEGVPTNLTQEDLDELAKATEGYSGSDISNLVKGALMEPVRVCHKATHFRLEGNKYTPCAPSHAEATEMSIMQVPKGLLKSPDVQADDFFRILDEFKPSVSAEDLKKHQRFTQDYGVEG